MKPPPTAAATSDSDGGGGGGGGGGGLIRPSRICYMAILSAVFWFLVFSLLSGMPGGGDLSSVLFRPSSLSLPLLNSFTFDQNPSPEQQPPPAPAPAEDRCAGRYIYMYDMPARFNEELLRDCRALRPWTAEGMCRYVANGGMGEPMGGDGGGVFSERGWFDTDQFVLDIIFHGRMKRYGCLTGDPAAAAAVFVPFYGSCDLGRHIFHRNASVKDALSEDLTAADVAAWQRRVRAAARPWLFSFAGGPRKGNGTIRADIIRQCGASSRCNLFHCHGAAASGCNAPGAVMRVFESSRFCLEPRGDTMTRRSTFDAILAGCIPVFFHPGSAYTQYTLHLPPERGGWSVLIPHADVTGRNVSIEETLAAISLEKVRSMREEVIRLIPTVVYADTRSSRVDFRDAFDVAVDAVVGRVARRRRGEPDARR
uniref:Exostosin GT47 domain-containing protein n=1 Tax=Oryza barthii TaxID=65489 RepID=A0A0D3HEE1_9ORYZ